MQLKSTAIIVPAIFTAAACLPAHAQESAGQQQQAESSQQQQDQGRQTPNPYARPDDSWITLSGKVDAITRDSFTLDYGDGFITVEMDDGDRDADAYKLVQGDQVTVSGFIDDDLFETTTIEASSVYVQNIDTYFYASGLDEEDYGIVTMTIPLAADMGVITGSVTAVDEEEFILNTGTRAIRVEVDELPSNPLDDEGYQQIGIGDVVSVTGEVDWDLFEGREFVASSITTIHDF